MGEHTEDLWRHSAIQVVERGGVAPSRDRGRSAPADSWPVGHPGTEISASADQSVPATSTLMIFGVFTKSAGRNFVAALK